MLHLLSYSCWALDDQVIHNCYRSSQISHCLKLNISIEPTWSLVYFWEARLNITVLYTLSQVGRFLGSWPQFFRQLIGSKQNEKFDQYNFAECLFSYHDILNMNFFNCDLIEYFEIIEVMIPREVPPECYNVLHANAPYISNSLTNLRCGGAAAYLLLVDTSRLSFLCKILRFRGRGGVLHSKKLP